MLSDPVQRNLTILLDPAALVAPESWNVLSPGWPALETVHQALKGKQRVVLTFKRRQLLPYFRAITILRGVASKYNIRTILYLNDGLLSSLFLAKSTDAYRAFAQGQLPHPRQLRPWVKSKFPLLLRADRIFIEVSCKQNIEHQTTVTELQGLDFLLYSNVEGKLLLTRGETLLHQQGEVVKTTADSTYVGVMDKEYEIMAQIATRCPRKGLIPTVYGKLLSNGRCFFREEFIAGVSLREALRESMVQENPINALHYLELAERWFSDYRSVFSEAPIPLLELYQPLFDDFSTFYGNDPDLIDIVNATYRDLAQLSARHPGLSPIIAHNDLWPGNFLLNNDELVAIDWERAVHSRGELFDYFWLIISTCMEYLRGDRKVASYSQTFRRFLRFDEPVCQSGRQRFRLSLTRLGFAAGDFPLLCTLFLMEWSVQGRRALGRQTAMDQIVISELRNYLADPIGIKDHDPHE